MSTTPRWVPPVVLVLGLLALAEVAVRVLDIPGYLLPAPSAIGMALVDNAGTLVGHTAATAATAVLGLALGSVLGVGLALLMAVSGVLRAAAYPLVVITQSIPTVVLAPLFVVWFGFGLLPRVLLVALVSFFPIALAGVGGLLSAERDQVDLLRSMGAARRQLARYVLVPGSLPSLFVGLKVAASYAMFAAVVGEWIGASAGLGIFLERSRASFATDQMFAAVVVIAALSVVLFGGVTLLERRAMPWRAAEEEHHRKDREDAPW